MAPVRAPVAQDPVHQVQEVLEVVAAEVPAGDPVALALAPATPAPAAINKRITAGVLTYCISFSNTSIFHCFTKPLSFDMYKIVYNRSDFEPEVIHFLKM